jgi:hypothetical protein
MVGQRSTHDRSNGGPEERCCREDLK